MSYFPLPSKPVKPVLLLRVDLEGFEPSSEQLILGHAKISLSQFCQIEYLVKRYKATHAERFNDQLKHSI